MEEEKQADYEQSALSMYASLAAKYGGKNNIPARAIVDLHTLLSTSNNLPPSTLVKLGSVKRDMLTARRKQLLEDLVSLDDEIILVERNLQNNHPDDDLAENDGVGESSHQTLAEKITIPTVESPLRTDSALASPNIRQTVQNLPGGLKYGGSQDYHVPDEDFISDEDAWKMLTSRIKVSINTNLLLHIARRKQDKILRKSIDNIVAAFVGYVPLDFSTVAQYLGIEDTIKVLDVLSSTRHLGIENIAVTVNPYTRLKCSFYVIREDISLMDLLPKVGDTCDSIGKGNLSYSGVSRVLMDFKLPADHELFDPVIETVFEKREEGTYARGGVNDFIERSNGYRFIKIKQLFGYDAGFVREALISLRAYGGELTRRIDVSKAGSLAPQAPDIIYMFKCDERWGVNKEGLFKELGLSM